MIITQVREHLDMCWYRVPATPMTLDNARLVEVVVKSAVKTLLHFTSKSFISSSYVFDFNEWTKRQRLVKAD